MFRTTDEMILAPTHEEEITALVASIANSYRHLPLRLYQIGEKFRNEARPRGGLLRCREFVMKDLYTFDRNVEEARDTYDEVCQVYRDTFRGLGLAVYQAQASSGAIGGSHSHEFHLECENGQDTILACSSCGFAGNVEVIHDSPHKCPKCSSTNLASKKGLEIGHTFLLGSKYSSLFDAKFKDQHGKDTVMEMGCYGIGVSRLVAAIVEASHDENGIIWPSIISPFDSYLIPLDQQGDSHSLNTSIPEQFSSKSILLDDRPSLSFSHKFKDALLTGFPNILVVGGKKASSIPGVEWYKRLKGGAELQTELIKCTN